MFLIYLATTITPIVLQNVVSFCVSVCNYVCIYAAACLGQVSLEKKILNLNGSLLVK